MTAGRSTGVLLGCWLGLATVAVAQELTPPAIVHLPDIEVEGVTDLTAVEALVEIDADGAAVLLDSDAPDDLRQSLQRALRDASFTPATADGEPISARIRIRLRVSVVEPPRTPSEPAQTEEPDDLLELGAVARVAPVEGRVRLTLDEVRMVPGAFGEPMRVLDTLPGTVPLTNGLPYAFVRGAPPAGSAYVYDGIRLPGLFHLFGGPGYVHPTLIGPITLHSGVPPARYGRLIGGALTGEGPEEGHDGRIHGEAEIRALDVNAAVRFPLSDDGSFTVAGRYGYPAPIVSALVPEIDADYWDYQLRLDVAMNERDRFQLVWLGVFDALSTSGFGDDGTPERIELFFHRGEARLLRRYDDAEFGLALAFGHDDSSIDGSNLEVSGVNLGPRIWVSAGSEDGLRLRAGAELIGRAGAIEGLGGTDAGDDEAQLDNRAYVDAAGRAAAAVHVALEIPLGDRVRLQAGLRGDAILTGSNVDPSIDPRLRLTWTPREHLELFAAAGLAHQPAVFFLPIPGLDQVALDDGLQRAVQSEIGARVELPFGLSLQLAGFFHAFDDLLLFELFGLDDCDLGQPTGSPVDCDDPEGIPRTDSLQWGAELLARYAIAKRVFGWASYTLAWSDTESEAGVPFTPLFDVRHVANAVTLVKITDGFRVGMRLHLRSGRRGAAIVDDPPRYIEDRLPAFYRIDAMAAYGWSTDWGRLTLTVEWFNTTLVREPVSLDCDDSGTSCEVGHGPRLFYPNASIRAEF